MLSEAFDLSLLKMPQATFSVIDQTKVIYSLKAQLTYMLLESIQPSVQPSIKKTCVINNKEQITKGRTV